MVITSRKLELELGINSSIATYFANDRKVPENNLFWKNKRIYISTGFGFLTIPMIFDLIHKCGVPLDDLLKDSHVSLMEQGFHKLKQYESEEISFADFLTECKLLIQDKIKQPHLALDLFAFFSGKQTSYFKFETEHKALARSDSFLFTLVDLDLTDEWVAQFLPYWYSLARPILLLDDFKDLEEDRITGDENTIIELGNNATAIEKAYHMGMADLDLLATINPLLANFMRRFLKDALMYVHIKKELLNQ